jgi:ABC-type multidrug transport system ATPase subunit
MILPVLALENIRRSYKQGSEALKGVSLSVKAGDVVGLIGRNGAGKTTLLRIAAGILQPHSGTVRVFGLDPWSHAVEVKLDRLEACCLAILPPQPAEKLNRLRHLEGFVRTRKRETSHHAVFARPPDEIAARLESDLGIADARCSAASLEEIFIALVGAES